MKKTLSGIAASLLILGVMSACSKKDENKDTGVVESGSVEIVEGEVVDMPAASDSDTTVIADAEAEAVEAVPAK